MTRVRVISGLVAALALLCTEGVPRSNGADLDGESERALATGTVAVLGSAACPAGVTNTAACQSIRVSCPGLPDLDATQAVALPSGAPRGTVILLSGGPGTMIFNSGFANVYLADGFRVGQVAWASDWAAANGIGVKS